MSAQRFKQWKKPEDITLTAREVDIDKYHYSNILELMEKSYHGYVSINLETHKMFLDMRILYPFIDVENMFRVAGNQDSFQKHDHKFLGKIHDLLFRPDPDYFKMNYFKNGYVNTCIFLTGSSLNESEIHMFMFRRIYDELVRKVGIPDYETICKEIEEAAVDAGLKQSDQRVKGMLVKMIEPTKIVLREAMRILQNNNQISLPMFARPEPATHHSTNYGIPLIPRVEHFKGKKPILFGARRFMSAIEKYRNDENADMNDTYLSMDYLPENRQFNEISRALKNRAHDAYLDYTVDPLGSNHFHHFEQCEQDVVEFLGEEFVEEFDRTPHAPTLFGYQQITDSYDFDSYIVDFTVTDLVDGERVAVGIPVRNVIPATIQLFKTNTSGPACTPMDILKILTNDETLISHWQNSNPDFSRSFLSFEISRYLEESKKILKRSTWLKKNRLDSKAFKEDDISQRLVYYYDNSVIMGTENIQVTVTTNIVEIPQINGWQNPNVIQKINFDLSQFQHEMLPINFTIRVPDNKELSWTLHRYVPNKDYIVQIALRTAQHSLSALPPKGKGSSQSDIIKPLMEPVRALMDDACIKKYDDYMLHKLHVNGSRQILRNTNISLDRDHSVGYTFHYNYWTVIATSARVKDQKSYMTFYTLIHWAADYANSGRSSQRPGAGDGGGSRKMIVDHSDANARIRLLEQNNAFMVAAINEMQRLPKMNVPRFDEHGGPWFIPGIFNGGSYGFVYYNGVDTRLHKQMLDEKRRQFESVVISELANHLLVDADRDFGGNLNIAIADFIKLKSPQNKLIPVFPGLMGTFLKVCGKPEVQRRWSSLFIDFFETHPKIAPNWKRNWYAYGQEPAALKEYIKRHEEETSRRKMYQARGGRGGGGYHSGRGEYRGGGGGARGGRGGFMTRGRGRGGGSGPTRNDSTTDWEKQERAATARKHNGPPPARSVMNAPTGVPRPRTEQQDDFSAFRGTKSEIEDLRRTVNRLALENLAHQMSSS